ncbi:MAG: VOC family protein [Armatimonadetes bacterium]|nr:VOC family protein [Armatimonadota bacterium]
MSVAKTHLSLNVKDVTRSTEWYEAFFGVPAHQRRPGYANFDLESPPLKLALQEHDAGAGGPLNHLGILVDSKEQVDAAKSRLETAGLVTSSEENVTCCYAKQDKIWIRDPDGTPWEVYTLLNEVDDEDDSHEGVEVSSCCTENVAESDVACCVSGCCE